MALSRFMLLPVYKANGPHFCLYISVSNYVFDNYKSALKP